MIFHSGWNGMLYFQTNPFLCLSTSINLVNHNFNRCYNGGPAIYVVPGEADVSQHLGIYHIKKFLSVQSTPDQSEKLHQAPVGHSTSFFSLLRKIWRMWYPNGFV